MSGFTVQEMKQKLARLSNTPESIQTLSLWLLHHHKNHGDQIMATWLTVLQKEKNPARLVNMIYLANDAIQVSKKKSPDFAAKFFNALEPALRHCSKIPGPEVAKATARVVDIFKQRQIYSADKMARLDLALLGKKPAPELNKDAKKPDTIMYDINKVSSSCSDVVDSLRKLTDPPSEDAETRHNLVNCPEVVGNPAKMDAIRGEGEANAMMEQLGVIQGQAKNYCDRLKDEMGQRRLLQTQIDALLGNVRAALEHQDNMLKEIKLREDSVHRCVEDIQRVHDSLPDLEQIQPSGPLPSADALFG